MAIRLKNVKYFFSIFQTSFVLSRFQHLVGLHHAGTSSLTLNSVILRN